MPYDRRKTQCRESENERMGDLFTTVSRPYRESLFTSSLSRRVNQGL